MLTGEAKKLYQREYMRKRRSNSSLERSNAKDVRPLENVIPQLDPSVRPAPKPVRRFSAWSKKIPPQDNLKARLGKVGLNIDDKRVSLAPQSMRSLLKKESNSRIPLFNPLAPQIGERVRMPSGEIVTVPELDDEGNPIPEKGSTGRLVSDNLFKPSFKPNPKPPPRAKKGRRYAVK